MLVQMLKVQYLVAWLQLQNLQRFLVAYSDGINSCSSEKRFHHASFKKLFVDVIRFGLLAILKIIIT